MAHQTRLKYADEVKSYIWDRYQQGDALKEFGRSCDRTSSSIHGLLSRTGGIRPRERNDLHRHSALQSARKYLEVLSLGYRSVQLLPNWSGNLPLCAGK